MADEDTAFGEAADAVEAASNTKALDVVARSGFAVMALLHIVIGAIAIAIALALGQPGQAEPTGAIEQLAANPWGPGVMWAGLVGCAGLALWQLSEATSAPAAFRQSSGWPSSFRPGSSPWRTAAWD
jgi:Domain of Unknown Function (DUF1206)